MVKVDVVSGFLGVGKTTLIKKLLKIYKGENIVIIENEFGDISIDGDVIKEEGFNVVEINSGCICCSMKRDFENSFNEILDRFNPERIIVEPTGINVLSQILNTLNAGGLKKKVRINSVITVIDAVNYLEHIEMFGEFFQDQIKNAKILMVSKSQMVDEDKLNKVIESLKELNTTGQIITYPWNELKEDKLEDLIKMHSKEEFNKVFSEDISKFDNKRFKVIAIKTYKEFTEDEVQCILKRLQSFQYGNIIRAKGFLKGEKNNIQFNYASGQYEICKTNNLSLGKLCIIGEDLKEKELKTLFKGRFSGLLRW